MKSTGLLLISSAVLFACGPTAVKKPTVSYKSTQEPAESEETDIGANSGDAKPGDSVKPVETVDPTKPTNPPVTGNETNNNNNNNNNSGTTLDCKNVVDECPVPGGVTWQCKTRLIHGVNYAWHNFSGDFGGIPAWGQSGVAGSADAVNKELQDMKANGSNVIRWWILPDFRGDGVAFDSTGTATGLKGTFEKDLLKALELADKNNVYLMMTIFSFDAFKPTQKVNGIEVKGIQPMILDAKKRTALLEKVVRPMVKIAETSPYKKRLMTWELINEPEWAMSGSSKYGDPGYDCNGTSMQCLSHEQMESFLADMAKIIRAESKALISVGGAAIKWKNTWTKLDLDYLQYHFYDWVNQYFPYTKTLKDWGLSGKPVVMGEYPIGGVTGADASKLMSAWHKNGFGGTLAWAVTDASFDWSGKKAAIKTFATQNSCETQF